MKKNVKFFLIKLKDNTVKISYIYHFFYIWILQIKK